MSDGDIPILELFSTAPVGPEGPAEIATRLVAECDEFRDLRIGEPKIVFLMANKSLSKGGRLLLGYMSLPRWQGTLGPLAHWLLCKACECEPDFIMVLDATFWEDASPIQREALVFHELKHACIARDRDGEPRFTDAGEPVWAIMPHDIEEFNDVVRRYGAWSPDIAAFIQAHGEYVDAR